MTSSPLSPSQSNGSATPLATDVGAGRLSCILDREGQDRCLAPPIGLAPTGEEDNGTMRKNAAHGLVLVGLLAWVGACVEAPTALIDAARARVDTLTADGQVYAPQEYTAARDAVGRLDTELQVQADRFALTRSYDRATELAGAVATAADDVARAIDAEQARLRTDTGRLVTDAVGVLDEARPAIEELSEEDAADLRRDVENVEASLAAVESALQSGQYTAAHEGAQSAGAAARDIGSSLAALAGARNDVAEDAVTRAVRGAFDLPRRAYVNGQPLEPGPYRVRLTDEAAPVVDEEPSTTTRWIELLHETEGVVAGRGLAIVISGDRRTGQEQRATQPSQARRAAERRVHPALAQPRRFELPSTHADVGAIIGHPTGDADRHQRPPRQPRVPLDRCGWASAAARLAEQLAERNGSATHQPRTYFCARGCPS